MRHGRIAALVTAFPISAITAWWAFTAPEVSRLIIVAGTLAALGALATGFVLVVLAYVLIEENLRMRVRWGAPAIPTAFANREASLVGRRTYRMHPIKFWTVLMFGNVVFGLMVCDPHERISYKEDPAQ